MSAARFGLYVHFPYCLSKCPYCDFASTAARVVPEARYTAALLAELAARAEGLGRRQLQSVFIGGGTPSLWSPALVGRLLEEVGRRFEVPPGTEITLEANPGAADAERFAGYRAAGVNRLSMGVQSFEPSTLAALGRGHDGPQAVRAYQAARAAGFENVSMDFIYGVHGQTLEQVRRDARRAASLGAEHLSAYALTLDAESLAEEVPLARQLSRGEVRLPDDELVVAMQRAVAEAYGAAGLLRYEVSNYARPGFHSRHNTLYWTGGEYLALGAGATGFLRSLSPQRRGEGRGEGPAFRWSNHRSAERYLAEVEAGRLPDATREPLAAGELFAERVAMGLRLTSGVALEAVCNDFGQPTAARAQTVAQLERAGLLTSVAGQVRLTEQGFDVHSAISARLI